jgi:hypothetical protein
MVRFAVAVGAAGQAGPAHSAPATLKKIQNLDRFIVVTFAGIARTIAWPWGHGQSRRRLGAGLPCKRPKAGKPRLRHLLFLGLAC